MGQRDAENLRGVDFRGDGLSDRTQGVHVTRTDLVAAFCQGVDGVDRTVHREENRQLNEHWQARGEGVHTVLLIELGNLLLHALAGGHIRLALVLGLNLLHLRLNNRRASHALELLEVQRDDQHAHQNGQQNDGQDPGESSTAVHSNEQQQVVNPDPEPGDRYCKGIENRIHRRSPYDARGTLTASA